jgi:hypothetical protein
LLAASVLFVDYLLAIFLLLALVVVGSDVVWVAIVTHKPAKRYSLRLAEKDDNRTKPVTLSVSSEAIQEATIARKVGGKVRLRSPIDFLELLQPSFSGSGVSSLTMKFRTDYAGEYKLDSLPMEVVGPLGFASASGSLPLSLEYVVRPRIISVATESLRFLAKTRLGEAPIDVPGTGTEFYEMREYTSGDDYRHINWKATARQSELFVNQGMKEVGGAYLLTLDAVALGFSEADLLASTFLSIANSLATAGVGFGVLVHEAGRVIEATEVGDPVQSLATALRAALKFVKLDNMKWVMELLPAPLISVARPDGVFGTILETRAEEVRSQVRSSDAFQWILDQARKATATRIVYVSGLREWPEHVMELSWQTRRFGNISFAVAVPEAHGRTAEDKRRTRSLLGAMRAAGIECCTGGPLEVASQALAGSP